MTVWSLMVNSDLKPQDYFCSFAGVPSAHETATTGSEFESEKL